MSDWENLFFYLKFFLENKMISKNEYCNLTNIFRKILSHANLRTKLRRELREDHWTYYVTHFLRNQLLLIFVIFHPFKKTLVWSQKSKICIDKLAFGYILDQYPMHFQCWFGLIRSVLGRESIRPIVYTAQLYILLAKFY